MLCQVIGYGFRVMLVLCDRPIWCNPFFASSGLSSPTFVLSEHLQPVNADISRTFLVEENYPHTFPFSSSSAILPPTYKLLSTQLLTIMFHGSASSSSIPACDYLLELSRQDRNLSDEVVPASSTQEMKLKKHASWPSWMQSDLPVHRVESQVVTVPDGRDDITSGNKERTAVTGDIVFSIQAFGAGLFEQHNSNLLNYRSSFAELFETPNQEVTFLTSSENVNRVVGMLSAKSSKGHLLVRKAHEFEPYATFRQTIFDVWLSGTLVVPKDNQADMRIEGVLLPHRMEAILNRSTSTIKVKETGQLQNGSAGITDSAVWRR